MFGTESISPRHPIIHKLNTNYLSDNFQQSFGWPSSYVKNVFKTLWIF